MDDQKTGAFIAALRKEQALTQKELAARLHISDTTVSKWERGAGFPDVSLIEPLCAALNITITELFHGERNPQPVPDFCEAALSDAVRQSGRELRRKRRGDLLLGLAVVCLALLIAGLIFFWPQPVELRGTYQSAFFDGHIVQIAVQRKLGPQSLSDNTFAQYLDGELTDSGVWSECEDGSYRFVGVRQSFSVRPARDGSFEVIVAGLNEGWPIRLEKVAGIPIYSGNGAYDGGVLPPAIDG